MDDIIWGCVGQIGAQAFNLGRNCALVAGFPETVPAVTIDRQCGSSQQAVHFAAQAIMSGTMDVVIAGGTEVMSLVKLNSQGDVGPQLEMGYPFEAPGWAERFGDELIHQFRGGNLIAERWGITGTDMNGLALQSHTKAHRAWEEGRFDSQVLPVGDCARDEGIRPNNLHGEDGHPEAVQRVRPAHRRHVQPDHRRGGRPARRLRAGGRALRPHPAGPGPHHGGHRKRPGADPHRARSPQPRWP